MASTDFIAAARQKIRVGDVEANRPSSEAVNNKISGSMNYLLDRVFFQEGFAVNGFFNNNSFDDGVSGVRRIANAADISEYYMSVRKSGVSGQTTFNVNVYDNTGAFVNTLFGSGANRILISGNSGANVLVGRDVENASTFSTNTGGHTIQFGTLNLTTLLAGYVLEPFVEEGAPSGLNLYFNMKLKEQ